MTERDEPQQPAVAPNPSRRDFINTAAMAGAGLVIVPRHVLGKGMQAPSDTVNIATIGVSGMGASNTNSVLSQNIVAFCDVDFALLDGRIEQWKKQAAAATSQGAQQGNRPNPSGGRREPTSAQAAANEKRPRANQAEDLQRFVNQQLPKIQKYRDYREMFEKQKDIDAVIIATPDHMHAPIALAAMDLGKHVYVQKPLCWSVEEARQLAKKAKENPKVVTQMGNQGHSRDEARLGYEYINSGAIGDVREVHVWTNRPLGYWPQGVPRPAPMPERLQAGNRPGAAMERPRRRCKARGGADRRLHAADQLAWDLFLGVAPPVDYHPIYHPFNWRGWVDWGQGALGDMGAHLIDHPFWSLKLGLPTLIETRVDAVQRRLVPAGDDDVLRVPGARHHAGGEADVVRRRADAAEASRDRRRAAQRRRRDPLHRQQGQDDAGNLRRQPAPPSRRRSRPRRRSRSRRCRGFRTRRTR